MARPTLYVAITSHGFGHATRTASILAEIQCLVPDLLLILVTSAPRWLLESYLPGEFIHRPRRLDVGVIQTDGLTMDRPATLAKLQEILARQQQLVAAEVNFIRQNRVNLLLADIPPLATAIAQAAGIPCWMWSNFGWDLIYGQWGAPFAEVVDWVRDRFGQCDRLFRLPFHEPMSAFQTIEDVGLTGGTPRWPTPELRKQLGVTATPERTVLLTFGGLGLEQLPYSKLERFPDWQFITFDQAAPALPNLFKITDRRYRPVDLMPLCGRVISKPGYGTFSEACRLGVPIVALPRDDFAEARFLLEGLQDYNSHYLLTPGEFIESNWDFLHTPLLPPRCLVSLAKDGNQAIAQAVTKFLGKM